MHTRTSLAACGISPPFFIPVGILNWGKKRSFYLIVYHQLSISFLAAVHLGQDVPDDGLHPRPVRLDAFEQTELHASTMEIVRRIPYFEIGVSAEVIRQEAETELEGNDLHRHGQHLDLFFGQERACLAKISTSEKHTSELQSPPHLLFLL